MLVGGGYAAFLYGKRTGVDAAKEAVGEQAQLKERIADLQSELDRLRTATVTSDSRIQVEKSAQGQLANQLKVVEAENAKLKEELTFFETLVPGGKEDRLTIHSLPSSRTARLVNIATACFSLPGRAVGALTSPARCNWY